jgi:hypothetical protein
VNPFVAIAAFFGPLLLLGLWMHEGPITLTYVIENVVSGSFAIAALVLWFCWANDLWIFDPARSKAKVYVDHSPWGRIRNGLFFAIQAGCALFAFYINSLSPEPIQSMAPVIFGWALGFMITIVIVKVEDLVRWLLRKNEVLPPAVEDRETIAIARDPARRRIR